MNERSSFLAASLALCALSVPSTAQVARGGIQVDTTSAPGAGLDNADVATSGDLSVVIYSDAAVPAHVWATTSDAAGTSWSTPVQVDSDATGALKMTGFQNGTHNVQIVGDSIYTVWLDERAGSTDADMWFARSTDRGATWSEQRLDKGLPGGMTFAVNEFAFAVSGTNIYVGMMVDNVGTDEIYLTSSLDGGVTFGPAVGVSTANGVADVDGLSLCAEGLTVHVAFTDDRGGSTSADDLFYRRSLDGGATFGPELQLDASGPLNGDLSLSPAIDCDGNVVAVVWEEELGDPSNEEVRATVSIDGGASFLTDALVSTFDPAAVDADGVSVVVCDAGVIAGWDDNRLGGDASWVSMSDDDGFSWSTEVQVSTAGGVGFPRFDTDGTTVVVSSEGNSPNVVEAAWSPDCGITWIPYFLASDTTGDTDNTRAVFNASLENAIVMWLSNDLGANNAYVGGFSVCDGSSATSRNAGSNPASLTVTDPVIGAPFTATVDMTATGHALAGVVGYLTPANLPLPGGRTLLVNVLDPSGELFGLAAAPGPVAVFGFTVPNDPAACGLTLSTQAVHVGGPPYVLSNAQDLTLGAL